MSNESNKIVFNTFENISPNEILSFSSASSLFKSRTPITINFFAPHRIAELNGAKFLKLPSP